MNIALTRIAFIELAQRFCPSDSEQSVRVIIIYFPCVCTKVRLRQGRDYFHELPPGILSPRGLPSRRFATGRNVEQRSCREYCSA